MKKSPTAFVRGAFLLVLFTAIAPDLMAGGTVDFSRSTNLKAIYDAGLRPWHTRGIERHSLDLTNQEVGVILPQSSAFRLDAQIIGIGVLAGNELSRVEFISQPVSLMAGAAKTREICAALGIPAGNLESAVSTFAKLGDQSPVPRFWKERTEKDGIRVEVALKPLFLINDVQAQVYVVLSFYKHARPVKFSTEPIKPPPGYEDASMEPPSINSTKRLKKTERAGGVSNWAWVIGSALSLGVGGACLFKALRRSP